MKKNLESSAAPTTSSGIFFSFLTFIVVKMSSKDVKALRNAAFYHQITSRKALL